MVLIRKLISFGLLTTSLSLSSSLRLSPTILLTRHKYFGRRMMSHCLHNTDMEVTSIKRLPRVLSIQSHTVHGYVGNKASTLPMQCLGFHVDAINTVTLSNHPGYPAGAKGKSLETDVLRDIISGLEANDLLKNEVVLTGYMRSQELVGAAAEFIRHMAAKNGNLFYVCDPVLGDNGKYYVPQELRESYLQHLLPHATVITPNQFEAEVLTGVTIDSIEAAQRACTVFHSLGIPLCILKGIQMPGNQYSIIVSIMTSSVNPEIPSSLPIRGRLFRIDVDRVQSRNFSGCGDLFSSLVTGSLFRCLGIVSSASDGQTENSQWLRQLMSGEDHKVSDRICGAMELVASSMSKVLSITQQLESKELCIVESMDVFLNHSRNLGNVQTVRIPAARVVDAPVEGIIFDMDGTLTMPGAIDFSAMYKRCGFSRRDGDIILQIEALADEEARAAAYQIVVEEEMIGISNMVVRADVKLLMSELHARRIPTAISTRNCDVALNKFLDHDSIGSHRFHPILHRHSLEGINKPDPRVSHHILQHWKVDDPQKVWFVGDSLDDMLCGRQAGCKTCLIITDHNRNLVNERPEVIDRAVNTLTEFGRILGAIN